jgi:hypothetical protein
MNTDPKVVYEFGPFRMDPDKQVLLRDGQLIAVTPKAFETLLVLVRRGREVVSKEDLLKEVWPHSFVEEANLSSTSSSCARRSATLWKESVTSSPCRAAAIDSLFRSAPSPREVRCWLRRCARARRL